MKHKTAELEGALLDAAVALAEGDDYMISRQFCGIIKRESEDKTHVTVDDLETVWFDEDRCSRAYKSFDGTRKAGFWLNYSGKWELAGPIIDRELIELTHDRGWRADGTFGTVWQADRGHEGDTPLIAAMRAYVASKFGEEVELP